MFRFPLLIAIVVVTGSFASKVEAGCSLKRWDWQQHPMIIKLPCTKILDDTNRVPVKLINPPKKGQLSSKKTVGPLHREDSIEDVERHMDGQNPPPTGNYDNL